MTRLALTLLLLATGAGAEERIDKSVRVVHDDLRGVTCYLYSVYQGASISCIPDSQLRLPNTPSCGPGTEWPCDGGAHNERELSPHETQPEPTPAIAPGRWTNERYQL
jgi:hypothetical protein